jgi:2-polyprenyl-3-methyl-5-hydroxy-6-metoxy-1,4-benzoquinol methylase
MKVSTVIDKARNDLVKDALRDKCDYILFIDSDIIMPKGSIEKLIDMDVDIASGLYFAKAKPYLPVARVILDGKHFFLEDFEYNKIIDVQGVGMGLCLIKASVFDKIKYPYFKFDWIENGGETYSVAEDLYFCDQAVKAGYTVKLNTGVVLQHEGAPVGPQHFNIYKEQLALDKETREELFDDLAEFEKVDRQEIKQRFLNNKSLRAKEFSELVKNKTPEELDNYYINNNYEIYDHFNWHLEGRRSFDKKLVEQIKELYPSKATEIVDYGTGGGQIPYMLSQEGYQVTVIEKNKKDNDFISFRFKKHHMKVKRVPMPIHPQFKNKFDVVLCHDVLEHIPDEEFEQVIHTLKSLRKPNGRVFATVSFGAQEAHPSHFEMTEKKKSLIMDLVN